MTPEQRLDRLERVAKLFVKAGLRERRNRRELDQNIKMVISAQIETEAQLSKLVESHAETEKIVRDLAATQNVLMIAQKQTDDRLRDLIEVLSRGSNGDRS
jgi:hypothetical protein